MKKTREQKGITLIALIITIVVLLILAVVTISSITNDGIMKHAQNAANTYNEAQDDEKSMLDSYLDRLEPCRANGHTYGEYVILTEANCETQTASSKERTCSVCGSKETVTEPYAHQFVSDEGITGACYKCGYYCEHPNGMDKITTYYSNYDGTHSTWVICEDCGLGDGGSTYDCTFENVECTACGYKDLSRCTHPSESIRRSEKPSWDGNSGHYYWLTCEICESGIGDDWEACTIAEGFSFCHVCMNQQ